MLHKLKIQKAFADAKINGDKMFEIRNNYDRGFQKGDFVQYSAVDECNLYVPHEISKRIYEITYVTNYEQKEHYVVYGERECKNTIK